MMLRLLLLLVISLYISSVQANEAIIDKVYHPYVLSTERKVEWRFVSRESDNGNILAQRLGYGHSLREDLSLEVYLIGERDNEDNFGIQAYEIESRWVLTEQGRYWADWGVLVELEKERAEDTWESSIALLFEKEINRTSLTMNLFVGKEWGDDADEDELQVSFRMNYRYRLWPEFQPAIEVYTGDEVFGIGPAFTGVYRYEKKKQLNYDLGFIYDTSGKGQERSLRFSLEWEF